MRDFARADDGCAGGGMHARFAEIGLARRDGGDLLANAFKLAAADVLEILALGCGGGRFVEIDGNREALPDFVADVPGHGDAVFNGDAFDGNEGNDVGGAHARMRALVLGEVDEFGGLANAANGGLLNGFALRRRG